MPNITIKQMDRRLLEKLTQQAKKNGLSMNSYIKNQLAALVGLNLGVKTYTDLSHLAGTWTPKEEKELLESIRPLSEVEEELWK